MHNAYVVLYENPLGGIYKTMYLAGFPHPNEQILHVYGQEGTSTVEIRDDWNNKYVKVGVEALTAYTREGVPLFFSGGHVPLKKVGPTPSSPIFSVHPDSPHMSMPAPRPREELPSAFAKLHVKT